MQLLDLLAKGLPALDHPAGCVPSPRGKDALETYRFGTGVAQHRFCRVCGVSGFYVPRSHPDKIDVNVRCLDGVDLGSVRVRPFDGRNWEQSVAAGQLEPSEEAE